MANPDRASNVRTNRFKAIPSAFPSHSEGGIVNTTARPKHNHTPYSRCQPVEVLQAAELKGGASIFKGEGFLWFSQRPVSRPFVGVEDPILL